MPQRVTIVGDGAMATVCSILLTEQGRAVTMWGALPAAIERLREDREQHRLLPGVRVPSVVELTTDDTACFRGAMLIVSAVPTQFMRSVWKRLSPHVPAEVPIISVAKGIENETLLRPTQVIADVLRDGRPLAALSGPNIAGEVARQLPATAVAASEDAQLAAQVQRVFSTLWFRVYTNGDLIGVELAGATKNIIAIAAGIIDGLGAGNNAKAALVTRGLVEITRLGVTLGASAETFHGLAGLGDLITTCISPEGRNRSVGERIGRGERLDDILGSMDSIAEGAPTTKAVMQLARRHQVEMPITAAVHAVLFEGKNVRTALAELMAREPKAEQSKREE